MRAIVLSIALMCLSSAAIGQDTPKPVLVDEIERVYCDDFLARMDALMVGLANNPSAVAVVEISEQTEPLRSLALESLVTGAISFRKFERSRLTIVRTVLRERPAMKFWLVPAGASYPKIDSANWNLRLTSEKAHEFYSDDGTFDVICHAGSVDEHFTELLEGNPDYRAHIVLREPTQTKFRRKRSEVLKRLESVDEKRLRFFYVKSRDSIFEYWLVRPKRK